MRVRILLLLLLGGCVGNTTLNTPGDSFTLYLVRHAEKQTDDGSDPGLTDEGKYRSEQLATWFQDKDIKDIWSSDYRRSRDTAGPLLARTGLELRLYDPRHLPVLVEDLLENRRNALVVGHSNTTPELARLLCQCVIADMEDSEYDRLIVVSISAKEVRVETLTHNTQLPIPAGS